MEEKKYQPSLKLALLLLFIGVAVAIHQFKVPPIMTQIADDMGASENQAPELMSVFLLICLLFSIPAGSIVEKVSTKKVLLLSALVITVGAIIGGFSSSYFVLLTSRGIEGFGFLIMSIALPVAVVKYADPKKVGFVMGIAGVWISVGSIVAFNTVPTLNQLLGWKGVWWIYVAFSIIAIVTFSLMFKSDEKESSGQKGEAEKNQPASLLKAIKNKNIILASLGFLVFNFSLLSMITFFPVHAAQTGVLSLKKAAFIASLPMILSLISSPIAGRLADKFGHKWLYSFAVLGSGVGASLMFTPMMGTIMIGVFILGLVGATSPPLIFSSMGKLVASPNLLAKSNSIVVLFQNTGMFLASLLFGRVATSFGDSFTKAGLILLPMAVISSLLILTIDYGHNK